MRLFPPRLMTLMQCGLAFLAANLTACSHPDDAADTAPVMPIRSNFDAGDEGWTVSDFLSKSNYQSESMSYQPSWAVDGGHVGGHIVYADLEHLSFFFSAPEPYRGDLSSYVGGALTYRIKTNINDWTDDSYIVIASPSDYLYYELGGVPEVDRWVEISVPLDRAGWVSSQPSGEPADAQTFTEVLSNVTAFRIPGETALDLVESTGLDEVVLSGP